MRSFIEMLPILAFVFYLKNMNPQSLQSWQALFMASGLASSTVIIFYLYRKWVFNRLLLGLNLYLIIGAFAFVFNQTWLYQTYESLQASGMLLSIAITGFVSITLTQRGFIGVLCANSKIVRIFSVYLWICALLAFVLSYCYKDSALLSETIPFFSLFFIQGILKQRPHNQSTMPERRISAVDR